MKFLVAVASGLVVFLAGGFLASVAEGSLGTSWSFFSYRLYAYPDLPAFMMLLGVLVFANGLWLIKDARLEANFRTPTAGPWGEWSGNIPFHPLRLFGRNLAISALLIAAFFVLRGMRI